MNMPLYCLSLSPPFFKCCPPFDLLSTRMTFLSSNLHFHALFFLLSCFISWAEWVITPLLMCYFMIIPIYICQALVLSTWRTLMGPWCVFYATRHQVYWGLTHNVVFYWYSDLISHTHKHANLYIYTTCYVLTAATFITLND